MGRKRRLIALLLSTIIVGAGQIYRRRYITGVVFLLIAGSSVLFFRVVWTGFNYWFIAVIFSWIVFWIANIIDAYKGPFDETAPCEDACPAGIKVSDYIPLIAENRFDDAYKTIVETTPFVATLGRICSAPCEKKCSRTGIDSSIAIRELKRVVSEKVAQSKYGMNEVSSLLQEKIAVIGGGPCGLTCAYELRRKGYQVLVYEKEGEPGGILIQCIPEYRLPADILREEIALIMKSGVEIKTNVEVGKDIEFKAIEKEFDAVFIATGANISYKLNIQGENLEGVYYGVEFLKSVKLNQPIKIGAQVVVIGGGNVAMDAARVAKRLGASYVHIVCLESRKEMPAFESEIERAVEEQIEIHPSWGVSQIVGNEYVSRVDLIKCTSVFDSDNKFSPTFDESIKTSIECDTVIIAIAQIPELAFAIDELFNMSENGTLVVNKHFATSKSGVFSGGDVVAGHATVVEAIGAGKRAAMSIDRYLRGSKARLEGWLEFYERPTIGKVDNAAWLERKPAHRARIEIPLAADSPAHRLCAGEEVEQSCSEGKAIEEAKRCLRCPHRFWY